MSAASVKAQTAGLTRRVWFSRCQEKPNFPCRFPGQKNPVKGCFPGPCWGFRATTHSFYCFFHWDYPARIRRQPCCWGAIDFSGVYSTCLLISSNWTDLLATKSACSGRFKETLTTSPPPPFNTDKLKRRERNQLKGKPSKLEAENKQNLENCFNHLIRVISKTPWVNGAPSAYFTQDSPPVKHISSLKACTVLATRPALFEALCW